MNSSWKQWFCANAFVWGLFSNQWFCASAFVWGLFADLQHPARSTQQQAALAAARRKAGMSPAGQEGLGSSTASNPNHSMMVWAVPGAHISWLHWQPVSNMSITSPRSPGWNAISLLVNYLEDLKTQGEATTKWSWAWRRKLCTRQKHSHNKSQGFHPGELLLCLLFATSTLNNYSQRVPAFHYFPSVQC